MNDDAPPRSDLAPPDAPRPVDAWSRLEGRHLTLVDAEGVVRDPSPQEMRQRLADGRFVWLDLHEPSSGDINQLSQLFSLHPLVIEDLTAFGQRPKADVYSDHTLVVAYGGARDEDGLVEVHCIVGPSWLLTLHHDDCEAFLAVYHRVELGMRPEGPGQALYTVLDALTDSFFPALEIADEQVDTLQEQILTGPQDSQMNQVFVLRQRLLGYRRAISAQRDLMAQIAVGSVQIPGVDEAQRVYFRDVYDHTIRLADMADVQRDMLTGVLEVYLGMVSNRRDQVMKQLTVISTIFLPLTFITGYFGQNFGWMVDHIGSWQALALGTGLDVAAVVGILWSFRHRGWL